MKAAKQYKQHKNMVTAVCSKWSIRSNDLWDKTNVIKNPRNSAANSNKKKK